MQYCNRFVQVEKVQFSILQFTTCTCHFTSNQFTIPLADPRGTYMERPIHILQNVAVSGVGVTPDEVGPPPTVNPGSATELNFIIFRSSVINFQKVQCLEISRKLVWESPQKGILILDVILLCSCLFTCISCGPVVLELNKKHKTMRTQNQIKIKPCVTLHGQRLRKPAYFKAAGSS